MFGTQATARRQVAIMDYAATLADIIATDPRLAGMRLYDAATWAAEECPPPPLNPPLDWDELLPALEQAQTRAMVLTADAMDGE